MVSAPIKVFLKPVTSILDYYEDWSDWLGVEDRITASSWAVSGDDALLTAGSATFGASLTTVWLSAGTLGMSYDVTNTIVTAQGRTDSRTLRILVVAR